MTVAFLHEQRAPSFVIGTLPSFSTTLICGSWARSPLDYVARDIVLRELTHCAQR